jgi:hypothetical protein
MPEAGYIMNKRDLFCSYLWAFQGIALALGVLVRTTWSDRKQEELYRAKFKSL